jgi:hypothetical protein
LQTVRELGELLEQTLSETARRSFPVTLILDSLDQLSPGHGARQLDWLPVNLPRHVKIVVSTLPEEEYEAFPKLQVSCVFEFGVGTHDSCKQL